MQGRALTGTTFHSVNVCGLSLFLIVLFDSKLPKMSFHWKQPNLLIAHSIESSVKVLLVELSEERN